MTPAAKRKEKRDQLKESGYRLLPERWVPKKSFSEIMKLITKKGGITEIKEFK